MCKWFWLDYFYTLNSTITSKSTETKSLNYLTHFYNLLLIEYTFFISKLFYKYLENLTFHLLCVDQLWEFALISLSSLKFDFHHKRSVTMIFSEKRYISMLCSSLLTKTLFHFLWTIRLSHVQRSSSPGKIHK